MSEIKSNITQHLATDKVRLYLEPRTKTVHSTICNWDDDNVQYLFSYPPDAVVKTVEEWVKENEDTLLILSENLCVDFDQEDTEYINDIEEYIEQEVAQLFDNFHSSNIVQYYSDPWWFMTTDDDSYDYPLRYYHLWPKDRYTFAVHRDRKKVLDKLIQLGEDYDIYVRRDELDEVLEELAQEWEKKHLS